MTTAAQPLAERALLAEQASYVDPPPTLEELKRHAAETDEGMESDVHMSQVTLCRGVFLHRYRSKVGSKEEVFVGANVPLYFSRLQLKSRDFRVPDLMICLEAAPKPDRPFWVTWEEEGQTPNVIVEILSPSTKLIDRGRKKRIYSKLLGIQEYYLFDIDGGRLEGYRLGAGREYLPIEPDAEGRLPSLELGGSFGVVEGRVDNLEGRWLRFFEPDGTMAPTEAEAEAQRAEAEAQRAEAEAQRAEAEAQRAEAEAQRADELAARLAEYERRFGALEVEAEG